MLVSLFNLTRFVSVRLSHSVVLGEGVVKSEVPSLDGVVGVALWWRGEISHEDDLTELIKLVTRERMLTLASVQ